jgi:hypothetical protein
MNNNPLKMSGTFKYQIFKDNLFVIQAFSSRKYIHIRHPENVNVNKTSCLGLIDKDPFNDLNLFWQVVKLDNDIYAIQSLNYIGYLDGRLPTDIGSPSIYVTISDPGSNHYLQWKIENVGVDSVSLQSVSSKGFIDGRVEDNPDELPFLSAGPATNNPNLYWNLIPMGGIYSIKSITSKGFINGGVDLSTSTPRPDLIESESNSDPNLRWILIRQPSGDYAIKNIINHHYLESLPSEDGGAPTLIMNTRNPAGVVSMLWTVDKVEGDLTFKNVCCQAYLDGRTPEYLGGPNILLSSDDPKTNKSLRWNIYPQHY